MKKNGKKEKGQNGSVTRYIYSAAGEKLRVTHLTAVPNITVPIGTARELAPSEILSTDSTDYLLGGTLTMKNGRIDRYLFDEGYCQASKYASNPVQDGFTPYYFDRDHLGSVRQVIKAYGSTKGTVVQKMEYYPSGLQFCDNTTDSDVQPQRYNGKELDKMHGLNTYDYGARQYNPVTARWDRMDPLCEKYYSVSPYAYCKDNPMKYVDIEGKKVYLFSTFLPNAHWLSLATHTFLVIQDSKGKITYAAYGPQYGHPFWGIDRLAKCSYSSDIEAYLNYLNNQQWSSYVKGIDLIPVPEGMTSDEFDNKVVEVINEFGNDPNIKYSLYPNEDDEGNCNSSTSMILLKAGIKEEELEKIKSNLEGIHWGGSTTPKPWTSEEQKNAVEKEKKKTIERNKRLDALQMAL